MKNKKIFIHVWRMHNGKKVKIAGDKEEWTGKIRSKRGEGSVSGTNRQTDKQTYN